MTQHLSDTVQLFWRRPSETNSFGAPARQYPLRDVTHPAPLGSDGSELPQNAEFQTDLAERAQIPVAELGRALPTCRTWLLFVGSGELAAAIGGFVQRGAVEVGLLAASTQKNALRSLRAVLPDCVLLETSASSSSRARFGQILRKRLPDAQLVAVGPRPAHDFAFDAYWEPPLRAAYLAELLPQVVAAGESHILERGPIRLDLLTRTVITPRGVHRMPPKQCALLQYLLEHHDQIVSRRELMEAIWETTFMEDTRTLDVHIRWLRQCIEQDPSEPIYLRTVRGKGYHLRVE